MVTLLFDAGSLKWYIGEDSTKGLEDEHMILINGSDYVEH